MRKFIKYRCDACCNPCYHFFEVVGEDLESIYSLPTRCNYQPKVRKPEWKRVKSFGIRARFKRVDNQEMVEEVVF